MQRCALVCLTQTVALAGALAAQSAPLSAIEGSVPAPVAERAVTLPVGLQGLWLDRTSALRATGAFFSIYQSSYASVRLYHAAVAFRTGPCWSLTYGQSEIPDLFDTSLTNIDPGLSSLRARALWGALDATQSFGSFAASIGIGLAEDDNVGDLRSSTVRRVALRVTPLPNISMGLRSARGIGGSLPADRGGRVQIDATLSRSLGDVAVSLGAGVVRGAVWRYVDGNAVVVIRVCTMSGRLVRVLVNERLDAGIHEVGWDGKDDEGGRAPLGVYLALMTFGSFKATRQPS